MLSGSQKGKGFQGVVAAPLFRWTESHGSMFHRAPGSIGELVSITGLEGKTLPGHMGAERVTSQRLKVIESRPDENLFFVSGAVPAQRTDSWS